MAKVYRTKNKTGEPRALEEKKRIKGVSDTQRVTRSIEKINEDSNVAGAPLNYKDRPANPAGIVPGTVANSLMSPLPNWEDTGQPNDTDDDYSIDDFLPESLVDFLYRNPNLIQQVVKDNGNGTYTIGAIHHLDKAQVHFGDSPLDFNERYPMTQVVDAEVLATLGFSEEEDS